MDKILRDKRYIALFVLPGLLVYVVFFLIPIFGSVYYSFNEWKGYGTPVWVGLKNYVTLFTADANFVTGLKNIGILLIAVLLVQLPLSLVLALLLSRVTKGVRFIKTAYFIPVVFSATAVGLVWLRVFDIKYGLLNQVLAFLNSGWKQTWLINPKTVMWAVIFPVIWCKIGYYLIILYAGIKAIPNDYYEAALLDGCTGIKATWHITIPLLRNVIATCAALCAIGAIREYPLIFVMTLGGPMKASYTPAIQMYIEAFTNLKFGYGSAIAVTIVIISLLAYKLIDIVFPTTDIQY